jgi:hypothetical protein
VSEKQLKACTQIVVPWISVAGLNEPVLRTTAIANWPNVATLTLRSERIALCVSELALFGRRDELQQMGLVDVSEPITRFHEMVTGV